MPVEQCKPTRRRTPWARLSFEQRLLEIAADSNSDRGVGTLYTAAC
jgi:hypothetical protein